MGDINAEVLPVLLGFRSPDFAEDVAMSEDAAGMANEQPEKRVFGSCQFYFVPTAGNDAGGKINDQIAALEYGDFFFRPGLALRGAHASEEFRRAERLG